MSRAFNRGVEVLDRAVVVWRSLDVRFQPHSGFRSHRPHRGRARSEASTQRQRTEGPRSGGSYPYSHTSSLFDVTSGSNGSCGGSYLCTAGVGYDGPTGLGTPNGTGAF